MPNAFESVGAFRDGTDTDIVQLQNSAITQQVSQTLNPQWVCRYPLGDVTFPEFMLMSMSIGGTTGAASAGTAHTHGAGSLQTSLWVQGVAQHQSRGGIIQASNATVYDTLGFLGWRNSAGTLDNFYLELWRLNAGGTATRLASVDVSASITTSLTYIEGTIDPIPVQSGERYMIRTRNSTSVANTVWEVCVEQGSGSVDYSAFTNGSTDTNKTSWTSGELTSFQAATDSLPWMLVAAKGVATTDASYLDDFNRTTLGGLWLTKKWGSNTTEPQMDGDKVRIDFLPFFPTAGQCTALYIRSTNDDDAKVECRLYNTEYGACGPMGPMLHCTSDFAQSVWLAVDGTTAKIYTGSSTSQTQRATVTISDNNALWSLYYVTSTNTYTVLKDGVSVLTWTDSGNVITQGPNARYGGFRGGTGITVLEISSAWLDNWNLRDWTP